MWPRCESAGDEFNIPTWKPMKTSPRKIRCVRRAWKALFWTIAKRIGERWLDDEWVWSVDNDPGLCTLFEAAARRLKQLWSKQSYPKQNALINGTGRGRGREHRERRCEADPLRAPRVPAAVGPHAAGLPFLRTDVQDLSLPLPRGGKVGVRLRPRYRAGGRRLGPGMATRRPRAGLGALKLRRHARLFSVCRDSACFRWEWFTFSAPLILSPVHVNAVLSTAVTDLTFSGVFIERQASQKRQVKHWDGVAKKVRAGLGLPGSAHCVWRLEKVQKGGATIWWQWMPQQGDM